MRLHLVSAYLVRQTAYISEGQKQSKIAPKGKLKEILFNFPSTFQYEFHFVPGGEEGGVLASKVVSYDDNNIKQSDYSTFITSFEEVIPQPTHWIYSHTGDYGTAGDLWTWRNVPYYSLYENAGLKTFGVATKWDESVTHEHGVGNDTISMFARSGRTEKQDAVIGYAKHDCYRLTLDILLPIFSDIEVGAAYATAAYNYQHEPTDANYDIVCSYIDQCDNPNG